MPWIRASGGVEITNLQCMSPPVPAGVSSKAEFATLLPGRELSMTIQVGFGLGHVLAAGRDPAGEWRGLAFAAATDGTDAAQRRRLPPRSEPSNPRTSSRLIVLPMVRTALLAAVSTSESGWRPRPRAAVGRLVAPPPKIDSKKPGFLGSAEAPPGTGNGSVPVKRQYSAYSDDAGYSGLRANAGDELANLEFASLGVAQALRTRLTGRNWRSRNPANPLAALAPAWHLP